jgi:hypothetical protein
MTTTLDVTYDAVELQGLEDAARILSGLATDRAFVLPAWKKLNSAKEYIRKCQCRVVEDSLSDPLPF